MIIGLQGKNVWLMYSGRCFLVALEHVRALMPDDCAMQRVAPDDLLSQLRKAVKANDYVDLSGQRPPQEVIESAAAAAPAEEVGEATEERDDIEIAPPPLPAPVAHTPVELLPEQDDMVEPEQRVPGDENMLQAEHRDLGEVPEGQAPEEASSREAAVDTRTVPPAGSTFDSAGWIPSREAGDTRTVPPAGSARDSAGWIPSGETDNLRWKNRRAEYNDTEEHSHEADAVHVLMTNQAAVLEPLLKKQLDREVPYKDIPVAHRPLYHVAEKKEWGSCRSAGCVEVLSRQESDQVRAITSPSRIITLRFVYRDRWLWRAS
jgi:hypothetical protein